MQKIKKRKWYIPIGIAIFIIIIVVTIFNLIEKNNKQINSVNDFANLKELIEYNDCKYIKTTNSKEQGYQKDIYMEFSKPAIEDDGTTNEILYKNLTSQIAGKMIGTNFRIIDESKEIIIRVQFKENVVSLYTINNDPKYFESLKTKYQSENYKEDNITNIQIQSNELNTIINNNWKTTKLNLGTMDSICDNYNIYFDEGYKIRIIDTKVYNFIFTKKYENEVFYGIKTGMTNEEIRKILGEPTYYGEDTSVIGYKSEQIYVFFSDGEISIYRNENSYDINEFMDILLEYNETGDYNNFLFKLTDLWPDYDMYVKNSNRVSLRYTLKGVTVDFNTIDNNGITLYKNFDGEIKEEIKNGKVIKNICTSFDKNLVFETEKERAIADIMQRKPVDVLEELNTNDYVVSYSIMPNNTYQNITFYSRNKEKVDIELKDFAVNSIYKIDDKNFIYTISNLGIYSFNIDEQRYKTIIEGNEEFKINRIENNTIFYDGKYIEIN